MRQHFLRLAANNQALQAGAAMRGHQHQIAAFACGGGQNGLRSIDQHLGPEFRRVRIGIGHPGHKDRVTGHVLGNYAKTEIDDLTDMLAALAAEADWLARGENERFMSDVALRLRD